MQKKTTHLQGYNEIYDANGQVRKHYRKIYEYWQTLPKAHVKNLFTMSKSLLADDYHVDPLPRLLTRDDQQFLRRGVKQRAGAIRAFLVEYYQKKRRWEKIIPPNILEQILRRHNSQHFLGKLDHRSLAFPFGPDIMRDRAGQWRIVEDSAGCLGGFGDMIAIRKTLHKLVPEYKRALKNSFHPGDFFSRLASHYRDIAGARGGTAIMLLPDFEKGDDHEIQRLGKIFEGYGVDVITMSERRKKICFKDDGVFLKRRNGSKKKIGYVAFYSSPESAELNWLFFILLAKKGLLEENQALDHYIGKSLTSALLAGHAATNFSPGTRFINDKMFGTYVDSLIEFYLKESPILSSLPSQPMAYFSRNGKWRADQSLLRKVVREKDKYVIKKVDEDGGSCVWIGCKHTRVGFEKIVRVVADEPEVYICQQYEPMSMLEDRIVDLRIHTHVDLERIIVNKTPWGRANWESGDGKVNLSAHGFVSPVVVL